MSLAGGGPSRAVGASSDPEGLFRLAIESFPSGVVIVSPDGIIAVANRRVEQQFGYRAHELIGRPVELLLSVSLRELHESHQRGFMSQPEVSGRTLLGRRHDNSEFPIEVSLRPLATDSGRFDLVVIADATEMRTPEGLRGMAFQERLEFEAFIAALSIQFINLPADQVDEAIRHALERIGESLDLDRCNFYRIQPDGMLTDPIGWQRSPFAPAPASMSGTDRFPWALDIVRRGRTVMFSSVDEIPNPIDRNSYRAIGVKSALTVPLSVGGELVGAVGFNQMRAERVWIPETIHRLQVLASTFASVMARRRSEEALRQALETVKRLNDHVQRENTYLRREVQERFGSADIVGESLAIGRVLDAIAQVAVTDSTVLLLGETGTGKELFANEIHRRSSRRARAMVRVNCSAIPETLIESELFGHEKGAYTGAHARQIGRFELADQSTIFLDEIGDLPADVQVKLLRVLEERHIERLGSGKSIRVNTRIIAATNRDLERQVGEGDFRRDLFYRLNVFPIQVPPLRERPDDIPLLVWRFVAEFAKTFDKRIDEIPSETMTALQRYPWPGNIRELRNIVERAMIVATGPRLTISLPTSSGPAKVSSRLLDVERQHIRSVLDSTGWRIRGAGGAAELLGLKPTTLETRLFKLGLKRPQH